MTKRVFILSEGVEGEVVTLMTYGAIVNYSVGGIEFFEMLGEDDYVALTDYDAEGDVNE